MQTKIITLILLLMSVTSFLRAENKKADKVVDAIIKVESGGLSSAIGDSFSKDNYSVGLGQIRLKTGEWVIFNKRIVQSKYQRFFLQAYYNFFGIEKLLLNPNINKFLVKKYILWLRKQHKGNWKNAIISYNTGLNAKKQVRLKWGIIYYNKVSKYL